MTIHIPIQDIISSALGTLLLSFASWVVYKLLSKRVISQKLIIRLLMVMGLLISLFLVILLSISLSNYFPRDTMNFGDAYIKYDKKTNNFIIYKKGMKKPMPILME